MSKDKENKLNRSFSLLCDMFKSLDPSFIEALEKITGCKYTSIVKEDLEKDNAIDAKSEPANSADSICNSWESVLFGDCDNSWDDSCNTEDCDSEFDECDKCCDEECNETCNEECHTEICDEECNETCDDECCNKEYDDMTSTDDENTDKEDVLDWPYISKVSIVFNDNEASLNYLCVSDMQAFVKYTDSWMSYVFENVCKNNINNCYLYSHEIKTIHFEFYNKDEYTEDHRCTEDDNILAYPDWIWDPELLSFYSKETHETGKRQYIRMLIDNNGETCACTVLRKPNNIAFGGTIILDLLSDELRADFNNMIRNIKCFNSEKKGTEGVCLDKKMTEETDNTCGFTCNNDKKDVDICMNCEKKNECIPDLKDYVSEGVTNMPVKKGKLYMYDSESAVRNITNGLARLMGYSDNYTNKNIKNYFKGMITKDIYLNQQEREYSKAEFASFVEDIIKYAIETKNYCYRICDKDYTVCFSYKNMVEKYNDMKTSCNKQQDVNSLLGFYKFSEQQITPDIDNFITDADVICTYLCTVFDFVHASIVKTSDDYLIICNY